MCHLQAAVRCSCLKEEKKINLSWLELHNTFYKPYDKKQINTFLCLLLNCLLISITRMIGVKPSYSFIYSVIHFLTFIDMRNWQNIVFLLHTQNHLNSKRSLRFLFTSCFISSNSKFNHLLPSVCVLLLKTKIRLGSLWKEHICTYILFISKNNNKNKKIPRMKRSRAACRLLI